MSLSFPQDSKRRGLTPDVDNEICTIIETLNVMGIGALCDEHHAFIDCTYQMLLKEYFAVLPPDVVVEVQDSVPTDEAVLAACRRLKTRGIQDRTG